ncbi:carbohydrate kinase family protein [Oricola thermophila]|uniref:Carbohydrate kinase n=1 Tax=Oricola thermophila TaxID=2742145 RepID=A0A6N1VAP8_9HYPH|nr:carbohydrate kinase family protein [Oricola thermophila]QKV18024.1 carbohydrate kinase [Oricola thermophila]
MTQFGDISIGLLGIGGAHVDRIGHAEGHFHPGASNPGRLTASVGGGAFNALRTATLRGARPAAMLSARGGDHDGSLVADTIEQAGIADLSAVFLDRRTASYTAILDPSGEQVAGLADMDIYETALPRQLRRRTVRDAIASAANVLVDANLPEMALQTICDIATGPVFAVAISPAKAVRLLPVADRIAVLFMNRREMNALAADSGERGLAGLAARGFVRAVVTGGTRPVLVLDGENWLAVDQPPAQAVADVTGAGDALAGATIARLAASPDVPLAEAVRDGIAAAQLTIRKAGPVADRLVGPAFDSIRSGTTIRPLAEKEDQET